MKHLLPAAAILALNVFFQASGIAGPTITVSVYDPETSERWPEPGLIAIRRSEGTAPLTVRVSVGGSADRGKDYVDPVPGDEIVFGDGQKEVVLKIEPRADAADAEGVETVEVLVLSGPGYAAGDPAKGTVRISDAAPGSPPSVEEAARFLIQAGFGPDQDSDDEDAIPENVEEVQSLGIAGWIDEQFSRPIGYLEPFVAWCIENKLDEQNPGACKQWAWWNRAMGVPRLRPDVAMSQLPDPLRQRMAFALSQLLVVSDSSDGIKKETRGLANYYDLLLTHSFGNYRSLLKAVALHPCMGVYLSHFENRKFDRVKNIHPDENFAREIMQLFTIGLWELNADGTRAVKDGQPVPTYSNDKIKEFARIFTGLSFGGTNQQFGSNWQDPQQFLAPMRGWDAQHDRLPKRLLRDQVTPSHDSESPGNTGTATMADVDAAIDNLFHHPNTGPFVATHLIRRLVTSNPSAQYVGRVAQAFADDGSGVRGNLQAVVKAILLDDEARSFASHAGEEFGKAREPFLRCVNLATAFGARSRLGYYRLDGFFTDHAEEPFKSLTVFNFFLPDYAPPGAFANDKLVAPEFQILNSTTMITGPNYFWQALNHDLRRDGAAGDNKVVLNLEPEMALNVHPVPEADDDQPKGNPLDPDRLIRRLDLALTAGTLEPENHRIIRETLLQFQNNEWHWHHRRLRLAIYLIATSAEFNIQR